MKFKSIFTFGLSCAVSIAICTSVPYTSAEGKKLILGDVDGNGQVNSVDASAVLSEYACISGGGEASFSDEQFSAADINKDGKADSVDASRILAYYAYLSTNGTLTFEEFLAPAAVTSTTTAAVTTSSSTTTVTASVPKELIINGYSKYDLLSPDKEKAAKAFETLSTNFCRELYRGYTLPSYYGDTNGYHESKVMLAILNHDQGISPKVLANNEALGQYSEDQLFAYSDAIDFAQIENITGASVDFRKYVIDEDFANFINTTNNAWINYENGDEDAYIRYSDEYISNNNFNDIQLIDNYSKFYYMVVCDYNIGLANDNSFNQAEQLYDDNVVKPMYESYAPYISK